MYTQVSFIERLTDIQIKNFLSSLYSEEDGYSYTFDFSKHYTSISVTVYNLEKVVSNIELSQYDSTLPNPEKWIIFLCETFGSEYNKAFLHFNCPISEDE